MNKLSLGLFFGGRSTEHEVSVISALQAYENLDKNKYEVIPVYVSKEGRFFTSLKLLELKNYIDVQSLLLSSTEITFDLQKGKGGLSSSKSLFKKFTPLDVALSVFHGSFGEDGCIQGVFELFKIPYTGLGVMGSAVAMDKIVSKSLFTSLDFDVAKFVSFHRREFQSNPQEVISKIKKELSFPMFVKPVSVGSSIGANKAKDEDELSFQIEVAAIYCEKVMVEEAFVDLKEVNCSALGYGENIDASVCEMPISTGELLSFEDKYKKGGGKGSKGAGMASLSRLIPAPISAKLTKDIQEATIKIFKALDGCGVSRIDYFVDTKNDKFWVNEVNSPPGSLSFYLWEPKGVKYSNLLDRIIECALERSKEQSKTQYTFDSGLLEMIAQRGIKR